MGFSPLYQVTTIGKGNVSVMPAPLWGKGLEQDIRNFARLGVDKIICLLEADEQAALGLAAEQVLCARYGIGYSAFPIPDHSVPEAGPALEFAAGLLEEICAGKHVAIHCFAGIGRTGIIAAIILVLSGVPLKEARALLSRVRGVPMPETREQLNWLTAIFTK